MTFFHSILLNFQLVQERADEEKNKFFQRIEKIDSKNKLLF